MTSAADLLRGVGLLADGPVLWGRQVSSSKPGVFVVELPAPLATAPIDAAVCGKWIEHVPTLRLAGEATTGPALARRLAEFWLPSETILYLGATERSLGGRVGALYATALGERRPHPGGHWIKTLRHLDQMRVWWAETSGPAEAELELAIAFAASVDREEAQRLPEPSIVLPFANLEDPLGAKKPHGLSGYLLPAEPRAETPTRPTAAATQKSPDARRTNGSAAARRTTAPKKASSARPSGAGSAIVAEPTRRRNLGGRLRQSIPPPPPPAEVVRVTAEGMERLRKELAELLGRRPAVIDRIRTARELGDLRENSEYQEARREQSFLEGRIQALEATLRAAIIAEDAADAEPVAVDEVRLGSTVVVESGDGTARYTLVGPREANLTAGRLSTSAPLGQALLGRRAGDEVVVSTPVGERRFTILELEGS